MCNPETDECRAWGAWLFEQIEAEPTLERAEALFGLAQAARITWTAKEPIRVGFGDYIITRLR